MQPHRDMDFLSASRSEMSLGAVVEE
jgi:hypothetical protein